MPNDIFDIAISHVQKNKVPAVGGRKCVDGGYKKDQCPGMIARPGADLGYVMALMLLNKDQNIGLSPIQCFDIIYQAVTKDGGKFYMHTDQHASARHSPASLDEGGQGHEHGPLIGCGHAAKAAMPENADKYGLDPKEMEELIHYALQKAETDPNVVNIHLDREHQELGVLDIKDPEMSVNPWDEENNTMFFVYDEVRDDEFMKNICPVIPANAGIQNNLSYDDLKSASDRQLLATLEILAKGKPIYAIANISNSVKINFAKNI